MHVCLRVHVHVYSGECVTVQCVHFSACPLLAPAPTHNPARPFAPSFTNPPAPIASLCLPHSPQVVPWYWYRDEAARLVSGPNTPADRLALASENEIKRMRDAIMTLRAELFYDINERLRHIAERLVSLGAPEAEQQRDCGALLPGLKTVAGVLTVSAGATGWGHRRRVGRGCRSQGGGVKVPNLPPAWEHWLR